MNIELMQERADHAVVLLKALANERRLFILCYLLNEGEMCVGEMNKKLLQKVEELTLYIIEMNKELRFLKEQLNKK